MSKPPNSPTLNSAMTGADAGDAEGLVVLAAPLEPGRRWWAWVVVIFFLLLAAGTGLVDSLWPSPRPELLGREKAQHKRQQAKARLGDGSLAQWIERDLRIRSRTRRSVLPLYAVALYRGLGEVRDELLIGKDGWLFLANRVTPRRRPNRNIINYATAIMADLQQQAADRGSRLLWVPIPRKSALYWHYLPNHVNPRRELDLLLPRALQAAEVEHLDLFGPLSRRLLPHQRQDLEDPFVFHKGDSHWTQSSAILAAELIGRQLDMWVPEEERRTAIHRIDHLPPKQDLLGFIGIHPGTTDPRMLKLNPHHAFVVRRGQREIGRRNSLNLDVDVVLVGTSFSAVSRLGTFMEYFTNEPILDASVAGQGPFQVLRGFLKQWGDRPLPPNIVMEIPNHMFFDQASLQNLNFKTIFSEKSPSPTQSAPRPSPEAL